MYINVQLLLRAEYLSLFKARFTLRRWAYVIVFSGLFGLMWLVVAIGRMLDYVLFPAFRRQAVRQPVFIVAPPRSGTTLLQKLMSLDEERFVHNKLYQTILPAVVYERLVSGLISLDRGCGKGLRRLVSWTERKCFGGWDLMHKMRLNEPEEDDGFFVYTFVTEAIFLLFLHIDELHEAGFADALPSQKRRRLMSFYRGCLQRRLYASGPQKTMLSKATQSSGAVQSLMEEFPDARFITIIRHPYKSVASHVSVFYPAWRAHSPELPKDSPVSKAYAKLAVRWYQHLFAFRRQVKAEQYYCIDYRELCCDPKKTLEKLYAHFGWEMSEGFRQRLGEAMEGQGKFQSSHQYTLEEFGLSKEWIQAELGAVLDHYALPR